MRGGIGVLRLCNESGREEQENECGCTSLSTDHRDGLTGIVISMLAGEAFGDSVGDVVGKNDRRLFYIR